MMNEKLHKLLIEPEKKKWIRVADGAYILLIAIFAGLILLLLPVKPENTLIKFSLGCTLFSTPIIAYALFRHTNLAKIERIAIIIMALSLALSLLDAFLG